MSKQTLWGMYDGEPFMENPHLGILGNPKNKKGKKMAKRRKGVMPAGLKRYWASRRKTGKRNAPKRRRVAARRRRNWPVAGMVSALANPRRKRHARRRRNPVMHANRRRHHRHRNPFGLTLPSVKSVVFAGVGFAGPGFVTGFLTQMAPSVVTQIQSMGIVGKYILKVGSIAGLYFAAKRFVGANEANMVLIGGGVNVMLSAVGDFAPSLLPTAGLMAYTPANRGLNAYTLARKGLNAVPRNMSVGQSFGSAARFSSEGAYGTADRFKRL